MNTILVAVIALGVTALVLAGVLFVVSKQFAVEEDPRVGICPNWLKSPIATPLSEV